VIKNVVIFSILLITLNVCSQIKVTKENFHIFILMGQSNMSGYGKLLPEDGIPVKDIFMMPTIGEGGHVWKTASHPLHNRLKSDRFGLGLPFAKEYLKTHPGVKIGIIPVAWGGATIDQLNKGSETYNHTITKALFAEQKGIIKGVLWHQGESDTVTKELANLYEKKLHQLIKDIRLDLGILNLPFIVGNLAEFYGTGKDHNKPQRVKQINVVKLALRALPLKVKKTGFVESTGCKSIDQHMVHFDRESYILLGTRYEEAYSQIIKNTHTN
jgi:hypothetical protein